MLPWCLPRVLAFPQQVFGVWRIWCGEEVIQFSPREALCCLRWDRAETDVQTIYQLSTSCSRCLEGLGYLLVSEDELIPLHPSRHLCPWYCLNHVLSPHSQYALVYSSKGRIQQTFWKKRQRDQTVMCPTWRTCSYLIMIKQNVLLETEGNESEASVSTQKLGG